MRRIVLLCALAVGVAGCFDPDKPTCAFQCADSNPKCPDDYTCGADNYCHLNGSNGQCNFADAAAMPIEDMAPGSDMTSAHDDGGSH